MFKKPFFEDFICYEYILVAGEKNGNLLLFSKKKECLIV